MEKPFPNEKQKRFTLKGPAGTLEVLTTYHEGDMPIPRVGVICHPHPQQGGTLDNKVVTTIARAFQNKGMHTVRFNYRGAGKSEGEFGHGEGETEDLLAIIHWLYQCFDGLELTLAGFSFGSYVAANGAQHFCPKQLITVAPAVETLDFSHIEMLSCPWLVVQGEEDEVVSPRAVYTWIQNAPHHITLIKLAAVSHFFHGALIQLREVLEKEIL